VRNRARRSGNVAASASVACEKTIAPDALRAGTTNLTRSARCADVRSSPRRRSRCVQLHIEFLIINFSISFVSLLYKYHYKISRRITRKPFLVRELVGLCFMREALFLLLKRIQISGVIFINAQRLVCAFQLFLETLIFSFLKPSKKLVAADTQREKKGARKLLYNK